MRVPIIGGLMLVAGLLSVGCGGTEAASVEEQSSFDTRADALPPPCDTSYDLRFYSEPEMINQVGRDLCNCGAPFVHQGTRTVYSKYIRPETECF
ncbi:hypothetical protein [Vitiosangium sp. GDMCC 1.1324]|uniref:hypothetical protein n=1 Tax=Vitiosangium sp. (strain GDMCC 1.1324) TaxID=2138576 RepID=UPI000D36D078|nr:hypothetical protein [Vitiosangium sp. GDMCC 1.1324]PTL75964.1 hypothetical protein DAT35_51465 [Vitiosangium sp. GDMCC 1.1324]